MNTIKWTHSGGYGIDGHVPQRSMPMFKIYLPGDPCNYGYKGQFELRVYESDGEYRTKRTAHPTLKAAKDAARRAYYSAYGLAPKRKVKYTWTPSWYLDDEFLRDSNGKAHYFVGQNFRGRKGHCVTVDSGDEILGEFPTRDEAKRFAEKLMREASND